MRTAQDVNDPVFFRDMEFTSFHKWQEIELYFEFKNHSMTDKDEIRIYKLGQTDVDDYLLANNVELWIPSASEGLYSTTFSAARLDAPGVFQAGYMSGNKIISKSGVFRTIASDDTDELVVVRPEELEDHVYWKRAYRILKFKHAAVIRALEEVKHDYDQAVKNVQVLTLNLKEVDVLRSQLNKVTVMLSVKEEIVAKQGQDIDSYLNAIMNKDKQLAVATSKLDMVTKTYEELRHDHENLLVDYELQQSALQNTKERVQAQEETKVLLQNELANERDCRAQMAVRLVNVCSEKYKLKGEIDKLRSKPLIKDALVGTTDGDNVINNALVNTSATEGLEARVNELVARLNMAALEYSNLYKENRRLERLCNQRCDIDKEKGGSPSSSHAATEPIACSTKSASEPMSSSSTSNASSSGDPTTVSEPDCAAPPDNQQPEFDFKPRLLSQGCQTCLPVHSSVAFQAVGSNNWPTVSCRGFTAGDNTAIPVCGKSRKMGHVPTSVSPNWRKSKHQYLARERRNRTPWSIPFASCSSGTMIANKHEEGKENGPGDLQVAGGFVAIEMPDLQEDSFSPGDPVTTKATPCSLCKAKPADLEGHLREVHMLQPCPVCGQLFDTALPASYLQEHVEDHFSL